MRRAIWDVAAWHAAQEFAVLALFFGDIVPARSTAVSAIPHSADPLLRCGSTCWRCGSTDCHDLVKEDAICKDS